MKRIEKVVNQMREFVGKSDDELQNQVTEGHFKILVEQLEKDNEFNIPAQIKVGRIETEYMGLDSDTMIYGEHYTVLTGQYKDDEGNEFSSLTEAQEFYEDAYAPRNVKDFFEVRKEFIIYDDSDKDSVVTNADDFWEVINYIQNHQRSFQDGFAVQPHYFIYDMDSRLVGDDEGYDDEYDANEAAEELLEEYIVERMQELEDNGLEPDDIMWNTLYRYNNYDVDPDLAAKCNLVAVEFIDEGHEGVWLTLGGCGMDLSPNLVAYQALAFGYVDESEVRRFDYRSDRQYFEHVVGHKVANEVYAKLGILEAVNKRKAEEQQLR